MSVLRPQVPLYEGKRLHYPYTKVKDYIIKSTSTCHPLRPLSLTSNTRLGAQVEGVTNTTV